MLLSEQDIANLECSFIISVINLRRCYSRLEEVHLQEALEVQVGHLVLVRHTEELGELRVGEDAALEGRIKAVVALHVPRDKLRHIRLALEALGRETHEGG